MIVITLMIEEPGLDRNKDPHLLKILTKVIVRLFTHFLAWSGFSKCK